MPGWRADEIERFADRAVSPVRPFRRPVGRPAVCRTSPRPFPGAATAAENVVASVSRRRRAGLERTAGHIKVAWQTRKAVAALPRMSMLQAYPERPDPTCDGAALRTEVATAIPLANPRSNPLARLRSNPARSNSKCTNSAPTKQECHADWSSELEFAPNQAKSYRLGPCRRTGAAIRPALQSHDATGVSH